MKNLIKTSLIVSCTALALVACSDKSQNSKAKTDGSLIPNTAFASTYTPQPSEDFVITNALIFDGLGGEIQNGFIHVSGGRIAAVGDGEFQGTVERVIDAGGKPVSPGLIDVHSHLGNYASPGVNAHSDGNEVTSPITSEVYAEHGVWPQDPGFDEALAGGVTTLHILPGSANLFGGRGVTLKNVPSRTVQGMKFPDAPYTLKMACGENPKRVYGQKGGPGSRMGNVAGYRKNWIKAVEYKEKLESGKPVKRDIQLETLAGVLNGDILVQMHCYRADEMVQIMDIAKEFGYKVSTFHHAVESYKIGDILAKEDVCSAMWADWYGFKMEANDGIRENIPFVHAQGACAMIHSDDSRGIQRLNQEVAKAWSDGNKVGLAIPKAEAFIWMTSNPAIALGLSDEIGSLEVGKRADIVLWTDDPFSTYARPQKVFIDGSLYLDRESGLKPRSDFLVGQNVLNNGEAN